MPPKDALFTDSVRATQWQVLPSRPALAGGEAIDPRVRTETFRVQGDLSFD